MPSLRSFKIFLLQFLEESGGGLMGLSSGSTVTESLFHPGFQDVLEFVRQCSLTDPNQVCFPSIMMIEDKYIMTAVLDFVASLIYHHFGIINISADCRIR